MQRNVKQDLRKILNAEDMAEAYAVAQGKQELDVGSRLYQQVYGYYLEHHANRAPYDTWKMRHEHGPDIDVLIQEWLKEDLRQG